MLQRYLQTSRLEDENHGAILPSRSAFKKAHDLPDGWVMEEVLRSTGKRTDKVYYFSYHCDTLFKYILTCICRAFCVHWLDRMKIIDQLILVCGFGCAFVQFYYEPGTGCKFRSKAAVERHLMTELNENRPLSILHQHPTVSKRKTSREDDWFDDRPPLKVNWALAEGNAWNPSIGDALISESVKLTWSKRIHVVYEH